MSESQLYEVASDLRNRIERLENRAEFSVELGEFPHGSCSVTSELLAHRLFMKGCEGIHLVSGGSPNSNMGGHTWVEVDDILVDITCDQLERFGITKSRVIVTKDKRFHHENFPIHDRCAYHGNIRNDVWGPSRYGDCYAALFPE